MSQGAPCSAVRRVAFDKRRGFTTSQATLDFVRRTCPCEACLDLRSPKRSSLWATNAGEHKLAITVTSGGSSQ